MKTATSKFIKFTREILVLSAVISLAIILAPIRAHAQNCNLPSFPTASTTATQERDRMMCQLGLTFPVLPSKLLDPNRPPSAYPASASAPEGDWRNFYGHTIDRKSTRLN